MKISLNWLKDFVQISAKTDPQELGDLFTLKAAEVEHVDQQGKGLEGVVIGEILEIEKHPNAEKLNIAKVDIGKKKPLQLIFGQMVEMKIGNHIPVAVAPTTLPTGMEIEAKELRGIRSEGMLCLDQEMGLKEEGVSIQYFPDIKPGTPLTKAMGLDDIIIDIDNKSLTHRPDLWGHYGIAREMAAITGEKLKPIKPQATYPPKGALSVEVKDTDLCSRYIGVVIEGIKVEPSPEWMQKRLLATGNRPINNIVDTTNYVMLELGQPLHAFDADKIEGGIMVRKAKDKEEIQTLDEQKRKLTKDMLVIADHKKAVAIAGVMGGANSEVEEKTTRLILEAANFNASSVRRTGTALGLRTEAVQRFEKSLDPNLAELAMDRLVELILQICPSAKVASPKIDEAFFDTKQPKVRIDLNKIRSKIGANVPNKQAISILESLQFDVKESSKDNLEVTIPSFRATKDVEMEDDITEEIARLYGYENIKPSLPELPIRVPEENTERKLKHKAREILSKGLVFDEVYNYSFYSQKDIQRCLLPEELHIQVENYLSEDQTHMRLSLVPNMLKNVGLNLKNFDEFKIYEIGRTYEDLQEYFPIEEKKICGMIVRSKKHKADVFYEAKGALEELFSFYQTQELEMRKGEALAPYAHPNKYASFHLKKDDTEIARVFEIHPLVAKNYNLENVKIGAFEINFTELSKLGKRVTKFTSIPRFPSIEFDVSVLIDKKVPVGDMQSELTSTNKELVENVMLFDLYEGPNIPQEKKSCAFKVVLRAHDRTLTDEDMKKIQQESFTRLQKLGGEIRGL